MAEQEKIPFGTGISKLLDKMNGIPHGAKEIFLWELVRNAARALYEMRRETLFDDDPPEFFIHIIPDKSNHTLSIVDNGIGMTEDHLMDRLFTIPALALKKYRNASDKLVKNKVNVDEFYCGSWDLRLGFFAAHMVADNVQITTKHYGGDRHCTLFSSASERSFFFGDSDGLCTISSPQGTKVTLQLKEDHFEYLDECRLKVLIDKYTFDICPFPVSIHVHHPCVKIIQRFADVEGKKTDMELMKRKFERLGKLFKKVIGSKVKKVVVSDRIYDLPTFLSLDGKTLEINPRSSMMEKLRQDAERNPKDEEVVGMINLQFVSGLASKCIYKRIYNRKHGITQRHFRV